VIAVDTNVLVAAHRSDTESHIRAAGAVRTLAEGVAPWGIPWPAVSEFVAITTHPRIFRPPSTLAQAVAQLDAWLASPSVRLLAERPATWSTLRDLLVSGRASGARAHDARIAGICLDHGVRTFWTADRDFSRFPRLRTVNPLVGDRGD
jgi:toxin-antitoxin system PIN domain toxin